MDEINPVAEVREAECSLNDLRDQIKDQLGHYQRHQTFALDSANKIGKALLRIKARLPHGAFQAWIDKNLEMMPRQVQRYMRVAKHWDDFPKSDTMTLLNFDDAMRFLTEDAKDEEVAPKKPLPFAGGGSAPATPAKPTQTEPGEGADDELKDRIFKALCKRCQRVGKPACDKCRVKAYRLTEGIEAHAKGKGPKKPGGAPSANGQAVFDWTGLFDSIKVIAQAPDKLKRAYGDCPELHALDRLHKEYEENRLKILQTLQKRFT